MRLIDADALKDTICSNVYPVTDYFNSRDYGMFWTGGIEKAIDKQPTIESAQPEIIRCKECKHLFEDNKCPLRTWWTHTEDDFCSYAERRTDGVDS